MLFVKRLFLFMASLIIALVVAEMGVRIFWSPHHLQGQSVRERFQKEFHFDSFASGVCSWGGMTEIHPHWGYRYHRKEDCVKKNVNAYGLNGAEIPFEKDFNSYTILLFGGSVAELLGNYYKNEELYFTRYLNDHWEAPNGKKFQLINAAIAAGQSPLQNVQAGLFHRLGDLAISLEGYNESMNLSMNLMFEAPQRIWFDHRMSLENVRPVRYLQITSRLLRAPSLQWLKSSHLYYLGMKMLMPILQNKIYEQIGRFQPYPFLPQDWTEEKKEKYYFDSYHFYLRQFHRIFKDLNVPSLTLIQPSPHFKTHLTAEEKSVIGMGFDTSRHKKVVNFLLSELQKSENIASLHLIYEKHEGSLFIDHIHTNDEGMDLMIKEIGDLLGKRYGWKAKAR